MGGASTHRTVGTYPAPPCLSRENLAVLCRIFALLRLGSRGNRVHLEEESRQTHDLGRSACPDLDTTIGRGLPPGTVDHHHTERIECVDDQAPSAEQFLTTDGRRCEPATNHRGE